MSPFVAAIDDIERLYVRLQPQSVINRRPRSIVGTKNHQVPMRIMSSKISIMILLALLAVQLIDAAPSAEQQEQQVFPTDAAGDEPLEEMETADSEFFGVRKPGEYGDNDDYNGGDASDLSYDQMGVGSNIDNAKVKMTSQDLDTAAGHHHHHKHYVSGKMEMGAHTKKKGAFGWHAKYPVGGKGRR